MPTPIHGVNKDGEEFAITPVLPGDKGYEAAMAAGKHYSVNVRSSGSAGSYFPTEPCAFTGGKFSCSVAGRSPLAGATFKNISKPPYFGGCGTVLTCIEGCGPRVPQELLEDPYECYPLQEVVCGSPIDEGVVDGDVINIRNHPHIISSVLRTATKGTRITVLKRDSVCFLMNDKVGQWVRVKLHDNSPIKEGWVFDAYIKYEYHPK